MSAWITSIVHDIPVQRLAAIMASWDSAGVDGICIVTDQNLPMLRTRLRVVRPSVAFARSSWRNIAVRAAPADVIVAIDADCAVKDQAVLATAIKAAQVGTFGVFAPAWGDEGSAASFLSGAIGVAEIPTATYDIGPSTIAGTIVMRRKDAIEISWDDTMSLWGWEDEDFCWRAAALCPREVFGDALVHVWHPARPDRCKQHKNANRSIAEGRLKHSADVWLRRALDEIAMAPLSVATEATPIDDNVGEATVRHTVRALVEREGWPALTQLNAGRIPDGCTYAPLLGAIIEERGLCG